jgi:hypothetical protein
MLRVYGAAAASFPFKIDSEAFESIPWDYDRPKQARFCFFSLPALSFDTI